MVRCSAVKMDEVTLIFFRLKFMVREVVFDVFNGFVFLGKEKYEIEKICKKKNTKGVLELVWLVHIYQHWDLQHC